MEDNHLGVNLNPPSLLPNGNDDPLQNHLGLEETSNPLGGTVFPENDNSLALQEMQALAIDLLQEENLADNFKVAALTADNLDPVTGLTSTTVTLVGNDSNDAIALRVNGNNLLEYSLNGEAFTAIEGLTFSADTRIAVNLAGGDDSLTVDVSLTETLAASGGKLILDAGEGNDILFGSSADTTWQVTGANAGNLGGVVEFSSTENLTGAANNEDTFVVTADGSLSGSIEGGDDGFDTLVFEGGNYQSGVFTGNSPNAGSIELDGKTIVYDGLEPIVNITGVADLTVKVTSTDNTIRIKDNGNPNDGQFIIESPGIETHILTNPSNSFTLDADGAGDTVILESLDPGFNAALNIIDAGVINVESSVRVALANLTFNAINAINVPDNITLETAGDISLRVDSGFDLTWQSITPFFKDRTSSASINIGRATLKGRNVDILTSATTTKFASFEVDEAGLAGLVSGQVTAALLGNPKLEFADSATTAPTIKRLNGSWIADGFKVGQEIIIQDSPDKLNDNTYKIASVTNDTITFVETDVLQNQAYDPTVTLTPILIEEIVTDVAPQDIPLQAVDQAGNTISNTPFTAGALENSFLETLATTKIFDLANIGVQVLLSKATSDITIGSGAVINASNNASINAGSVSDATMAAISLLAGFVYVTSDAISKATVKNGATITAGNQFNLDALVTNNMNAAIKVFSGLISRGEKRQIYQDSWTSSCRRLR